MKKLLDEFEKKCIWLGELQAAQQVIGNTMCLSNGNTLQAEINMTIKEIMRLRSEIEKEKEHDE